MSDRQPTPGVHENFAASAIGAPTSEPRDRFLAAFERAIHECKLMANEPVEGRPDRDKYFYRGVAAAVDTLEIFLAREKSRTPPPQSHVEGVDIPRLPVGTPVTKVLGYPFPGTVVSAFHTLSGQERFVVEATGEAYRGMLHIFNGDQLRATTEAQPWRHPDE